MLVSEGVRGLAPKGLGVDGFGRIVDLGFVGYNKPKSVGCDGFWGSIG